MNSKSSTPHCLPCPFCGGEAAVGTTTISRQKDEEGNYGSFTGYSVNCVWCGANNRSIAEGYKTPELAVEKWNTRQTQSESGDIEKLQEALSELGDRLLEWRSRALKAESTRSASGAIETRVVPSEPTSEWIESLRGYFSHRGMTPLEAKQQIHWVLESAPLIQSTAEDSARLDHLAEVTNLSVLRNFGHMFTGDQLRLLEKTGEALSSGYEFHRRTMDTPKAFRHAIDDAMAAIDRSFSTDK